MSLDRDTTRLLSPTLAELERVAQFRALVDTKYESLLLRALDQGHPRAVVAQAANLSVGQVAERRRRSRATV